MVLATCAERVRESRGGVREIVGTEIRVQGVEVGVQEQNSGGMVLQKPLQGGRDWGTWYCGNGDQGVRYGRSRDRGTGVEIEVHGVMQLGTGVSLQGQRLGCGNPPRGSGPRWALR